MRYAIWMAAVTFGIVGVAYAQGVPAHINYQGMLVDAVGDPLADGNYKLTFNIYDAATEGAAVWGPQVFETVPVLNGYFSIILGAVDANDPPRSLAEAFGGSVRYLEITVGDGAPMAPRQQVLTVPYAMVANVAQGVTPSAITTEMIANAAITSTQIAAAAITSSQIEDGQVQTVDLAGNAVNSDKIEDGQVQTVDIADGAITSAKIADGAITAAMIPADSIDSSKIVDGQVQTVDIAAGAITAPLLAPGAIQGALGTGNLVMGAVVGDAVFSATTRVDINAGQVTITIDEDNALRPVLVSIKGWVGNGTGNGLGLFCNIFVVRETQSVDVDVLQIPYLVIGVGAIVPLPHAFIDVPGAGTHTYSLEAISHNALNHNLVFQITVFQL